MNYYEKVRDAVERIAECTTSDAQGIIEAWERRSPEGIDGHEEVGTDPEKTARVILCTSVRHDARTGQYVPTVNGVDLPVTTFDQQRAWELASAAILTNP
jgi:hypothetical protein